MLSKLERLENEFREVSKKRNDAYWYFTRCARGDPVPAGLAKRYYDLIEEISKHRTKMKNTSTKAKRGRGRPSITGETGTRYQVTIPPSIAAKLRTLGNGSLSRGIVNAIAKNQPKN